MNQGLILYFLLLISGFFGDKSEKRNNYTAEALATSKIEVNFQITHHEFNWWYSRSNIYIEWAILKKMEP